MWIRLFLCPTNWKLVRNKKNALLLCFVYKKQSMESPLIRFAKSDYFDIKYGRIDNSNTVDMRSGCSSLQGFLCLF